MCHLTERTIPKPVPPLSLKEKPSIQREEPISVAPATEALALFCSLNQKRKLPEPTEGPAQKLHKTNFPGNRNQEQSILDAARSGNLSALQNFVSGENFDINATDQILGNTPLHFAVFGNHMAFVQRLLQCPNIDVNAKNRNGSSPLLSAIDYGHSAIVRMLVSAGASVSLVDKQGFSAFHKAVLTGNLEILRFLLKQDPSNIDSQSSEQRLTPLHQAAFHGKTGAMKVLLCAGCSVSPPSTNGTTPLHMATLKNHPKAMALLIKHGAEVDVQDKHERTPLHYACLFGHIDAASVLCKANCSVSIQDFKTQTPLGLATRGGLDDLLKVLLPLC